MKHTAMHGAVIGCLATLALTAAPVRADVTDDLKAELAAQRAGMEAQRLRLEALEKKLEAATVAQVEATKAATAGAAAKSGGLSMPKGFTIYGIADAGVEIGDYGQGTKARVQSGLGSASRLGFKGERSFGDDLAAYFQLEAGISYDNGQNTGHSSNISNPGQGAASSSAPNTTGIAIFSRNTFVGLRGKFGDVRFGRDYAPIYSITSASDPFTIGGATAFRLWSSAGLSRFDNGVFYASPVFRGFQGKVAYSAGMENNNRANVGITGANTSIGPEDEGKGWSGSLTYKNGPLFLGTGYLSFKRAGTVVEPATENVERRLVEPRRHLRPQGGQALRPVPRRRRQAGRKKQDPGSPGLVARCRGSPGEVHTVRAVYGQLNDRMPTNRDSDHIGVGYEYALDKQTDLYAYYAQVTNQNGGKNSLCAGGSCQGFDGDTNLPADFTPKSLMLGARYRF